MVPDQFEVHRRIRDLGDAAGAETEVDRHLRRRTEALEAGGAPTISESDAAAAELGLEWAQRRDDSGLG